MHRYIPAISVALLIVLILGGIFLWWPKFQEFLDLRTELEAKEEQKSQKEEYFAQLNILDDKLETYAEELSKVDSALPLDTSIPILFDFMQRISAENGLILESISLGNIIPSKDKSNIEEIPLLVSVSGSYAAFKNFLNALYNNARLIETNSINFGSPLSQEDEFFGQINLFQLNLTLTTHGYSEEVKVETEEETGRVR